MHQHLDHVDMVIDRCCYLSILGGSCRLAGILLVTGDIGNILDQGEASLITPSRIVNDRVKGDVMCRMLHGEGTTHRPPSTSRTRTKQHNERRGQPGGEELSLERA